MSHYEPLLATVNHHKHHPQVHPPAPGHSGDNSGDHLLALPGGVFFVAVVPGVDPGRKGWLPLGAAPICAAAGLVLKVVPRMPS